MALLKVYIASKFRHGKRWRELDWPFEITSRWITHYADNIPDEPQYCKIGWMHDIEDVSNSDVVVVYGGDHNDDRLRGALVEAGAALALNKQVIIVGNNPDFGTWQYHPHVHCVKDMLDAHILLTAMSFR